MTKSPPSTPRSVTLTTAQLAKIQEATGLSHVRIRFLYQSGVRPTNSLTAEAWDKVVSAVRKAAK